MALQNYSNSLHVVVINGRTITNWGETATPYNDQQIDPKSQLRRGQGGQGIRLDRKNPGRTQTLTLNPGSPDAAYMQGLFNAGTNIVCSVTQIGTLETFAGAEGVITSDGAVGRAGTTITDDVFTIEYNVWTALKGGA